jgi:hypothetical protein
MERTFRACEKDCSPRCVENADKQRCSRRSAPPTHERFPPASQIGVNVDERTGVFIAAGVRRASRRIDAPSGKCGKRRARPHNREIFKPSTG